MNDQDPQRPPQQPYGQQPSYGYPPPGPGGYAQQGFPQPGYGPPLPPKHPQAQTALVLGIIAVVGGFACFFPFLISPFAWFIGAKAKREIAAEPGRWSGQGDAQAGFILGIIGTVLIILTLAFLLIGALIIGLAVSSGY